MTTCFKTEDLKKSNNVYQFCLRKCIINLEPLKEAPFIMYEKSRNNQIAHKNLEKDNFKC